MVRFKLCSRFVRTLKRAFNPKILLYPKYLATKVVIIFQSWQRIMTEDALFNKKLQLNRIFGVDFRKIREKSRSRHQFFEGKFECPACEKM